MLLSSYSQNLGRENREDQKEPVVMRTLLTAFILALVSPIQSFAGDSEFIQIFDGNTLDGWNAADMRYWSIKDGAITGKSTKELPAIRNHYLVWQGGALENFELKITYRMISTKKVNGGFQFRSEMFDGVIPNDCRGYQVDNNTNTPWLVRLYDEFGRHTLAWRGERAVFHPDGTVTKTSKFGRKNGPANFSLAEWHQYHLVCIGSLLTLRINGKIVAEVEDNDPSQQDFSGILALQLHSGPPMTVQFKDIMVKKHPHTMPAVRNNEAR